MPYPIPGTPLFERVKEHGVSIEDWEYLARKLEATSRFGAYYDATTDFILIIGIFVIFYAMSYYPSWFLILIAASFIQFLATSQYFKKLYNP